MTSSEDGRAVVEASGLVKRYGDRTAVAGIDLEIHRGEAFGLLGPNGAGKSTTMRMIGATSPPTSGHLRVLGFDPVSDGPALRARIGSVPQEDMLDTELTLTENLMIHGRYFGLPRATLRERIPRLLDFVQLADRAGERVEPLSGGMKRRLVIARGLVNEPELLLLDEPTTGLDPQARHLVWDRLGALKRQGTTLVVTTHYLDEAEQLCDRLVVIDGGRVIASGTPAGLVAAHVTREVLELRAPFERLAPLAAAVVGVGTRAETLRDRVLVYADDADAAADEVARRGLHVDESLRRRATLEDVFLALTGRRLVE